MTSPSYLARCVKLYVKRGFNEDRRTDTANPPTLSGTHGARNPQHIEKATGNTRTGAEHLSSLYTLVLGTTIGFLASVTAYTIGSVVHHDRASHFIEVLLSTPLTAGSYIASVVLASLIHGAIAYTIAASTYTLVALNLVAPTARTILLSSWIYTAALLMTILTSLASIAVNFAATRLSMDPSRLSTIPSMLLFLIAVFIMDTGAQALGSGYLYTFTATLLAAIGALRSNPRHSV